MSAVDERVWLRHPGHGGYFHCPEGAVEAWTDPELGWQVADGPPPEDNPVVAELVAFQAARAAEQEAEAEQAAPKTSRRSGTGETTQEG